MPSPRRTRALLLALFIGVVVILFYNRHERALEAGGKDFFSRTASGLDRAEDSTGQRPLDAAKVGGVGSPRIDHDDDGSVDEDDEEVAQAVAERLHEAEQKAKDLANSKSPNKPDNPEKLIGVGNSAGRPGTDDSKQDAMAEERDNVLSSEGSEVSDEMDRILRRSPVIIFSKTYCPHSRKAKRILLEEYEIDPRPYVVELDEHPLGQKIQDRLLEMTGRRTVPNVLVNGKSIGGGSEVEDLHNRNRLITEVESLGSVGGGKSPSVTVRHARP